MISLPVTAELPIVRARLDELDEFLAQRLSADDHTVAVDLILCTLLPGHSARRHREATEALAAPVPQQVATAQEPAQVQPEALAAADMPEAVDEDAANPSPPAGGVN